MKMRLTRLVVMVAALMVLNACNKSDPYTPPPAPAIPNNLPGGYGFAGSCGGGGTGTPFNQNGQPYYGRLYSHATGGSNSSIALQLFMDQYGRVEDSVRNITGAATLNLPDLAYLTGGYGSQGPLCASSVDIQTGAPFPGMY